MKQYGDEVRDGWWGGKNMGGGGEYIKPNLQRIKAQGGSKKQSCSECPGTHLVLEVLKIRQNFENWKLFVTVYGQPNRRTDGNHSEQSSRSALKTARLITH